MYRLRQATADDAKDAVALILSSAPEALPRLFSQHTAQLQYSAQTFLEQAFLQQQGQFGFANHWVIEMKGSLAAIGCVWQREMGAEYVQATLKSMTEYYQGPDVLDVLQRCQSLQHVFARPAAEEACIGHIGVAAPFQRQGLCSELLGHLAATALDLGKQYLTLDVKQDNVSAISCYQKFGFSAQRTTVDNSPMKLGAYLHMRKKL
ncbi:GCN5-related N-acetyltransferase [Glaciecola sp. 4H-3-7+YE-5]|nr:GCN5-related N-acetyltransferase [Glaciecola sp. 4H-3-7+YE-5]